MLSMGMELTGRNPRLRALLNWDRRLEIVRGVARGVAYLHGLSEEVIHRDLNHPIYFWMTIGGLRSQTLEPQNFLLLMRQIQH